MGARAFPPSLTYGSTAASGRSSRMPRSRWYRPADFDAQCRLAWRNVERVLTEAGLSLRHRPALTIIITDVYSEEWLLEIEGMAVA